LNVAVVDLVMGLFRRRPDHFVRKADIQRDRKDWSAAAAEYRRALDLDPMRAAIWVQYGHALKESGHPGKAEAAYRRALVIEPENADTHLQLGHARKIQGDIAGAADSYRDAMRIDPAMIDPVRELDALGVSRARATTVPVDEMAGRLVSVEGQLTPLVQHVGTLLSHLGSSRAVHFETRRLSDRMADVEALQARLGEGLTERVTGLEEEVGVMVAHLPAILSHVSSTKALGFEVVRHAEAARLAEVRQVALVERLAEAEVTMRAMAARLEASDAVLGEIEELRAAQNALVTHFAEVLPTLAGRSSFDTLRTEFAAKLETHGAEITAVRDALGALEASLDDVPNREAVGRAVAGLRSEVAAQLAPISAAQLEAARQLAAEHGFVASAEARLNDFDRFRQDSAAMLAYLDGRVEFIRRELMYEFHHGARRGSDFGAVLLAEPLIRDPVKVEQALAAGARVNVGCGHLPIEGYLNVDRRDLPGVDVVAEADDMPFPPGSLVELRSSHLLEHFPQETLLRRTLPHWKSLLRPDGRLLAIVPDGQAMLDACSAGTYPFAEFREVLFGAQDYEGDYHYNLLTPATLETILRDAGFDDVRLLEAGRRNGKCFEFEMEARRS